MSATQLIDKKLSELPCISYPLSIHDNCLWYDTQMFSEIAIAKFPAQYDKDNRCIDGLSYKIKEMEIILFREPPLEMDIRQNIHKIGTRLHPEGLLMLYQTQY